MEISFTLKRSLELFEAWKPYYEKWRAIADEIPGAGSGEWWKSRICEDFLISGMRKPELPVLDWEGVNRFYNDIATAIPVAFLKKNQTGGK